MLVFIASGFVFILFSSDFHNIIGDNIDIGDVVNLMIYVSWGLLGFKQFCILLLLGDMFMQVI